MSFRSVVALLAILSLSASPAAARQAASGLSKKKNAENPAPLTKEQQRLALLKQEAAADVDRQAT